MNRTAVVASLFTAISLGSLVGLVLPLPEQTRREEACVLYVEHLKAQIDTAPCPTYVPRYEDIVDTEFAAYKASLTVPMCSKLVPNLQTTYDMCVQRSAQ